MITNSTGILYQFPFTFGSEKFLRVLIRSLGRATRLADSEKTRMKTTSTRNAILHRSTVISSEHCIGLNTVSRPSILDLSSVRIFEKLHYIIISFRPRVQRLPWSVGEPKCVQRETCRRRGTIRHYCQLGVFPKRLYTS